MALSSRKRVSHVILRCDLLPNSEFIVEVSPFCFPILLLKLDLTQALHLEMDTPLASVN
jgi:hypothetical protein